MQELTHMRAFIDFGDNLVLFLVINVDPYENQNYTATGDTNIQRVFCAIRLI